MVLPHCNPFALSSMPPRNCHKCGESMRRTVADDRQHGAYSCNPCEVVETVSIAPVRHMRQPTCIHCCRYSETIMVEQPNSRGAWAGKSFACPKCRSQTFIPFLQPSVEEILGDDDSAPVVAAESEVTP